MAGRNGFTREAFDHRRGYPPAGLVARGPLARPVPPSPIVFEEELQIQQVELRRLLEENRRLVDDRIALERELIAAREELRRMNLAIADMRSERELQSRDLIERGLKMEADLRATEPLKNEVAQLRAEIQRLNAIKQDLSGKVQDLSQDCGKLLAVNQQIPFLSVELDGLHQEMLRARAAVDYEKNAKVQLMAQKQVMEKKLVAMAREVEKLRSELANSGARAWNAGGPHGMNLSNPNANFPAPYSDGYGLHQGALDKGPSYGSGSAPRGGVEKPGMNRR
ncbi:hypothetical protein BUALT_Bualt07G0156800 [Buddleja alternifolia]|uniref:Protein FLX-like 3 n=1 Tax=Buddleja alternifolia TaxID=168488 RepID=A0AAV6XB34_9LAMI|nr:hypothetical protein BUALT_Bualt07G0156800 [Buddleja alternifolia]